MVLKILISLLIVCAALIVAHIVDRVRIRERNKMSFMEAFPKGTNVVGSTGNCACTETIRIPLTYKDNTYSADLYVLESLDESFKSIKETDGVQLHGILGTLFLQKHNFVLDFDELVAYKKK